MKKFLLLCISLLLLLPTASVYAQNGNSVNTRSREETQVRMNDSQEDAATVRENVRTRAEEKNQAATQQIQARRKTQIQQHLQKMHKRYFSFVDRFDTLIARIESRLAILEVEDPEYDTETIMESLEEAKALLVDAKAKIEALTDTEEETVLSETPSAYYKMFKEDVLEIKEDFKEIHSMLVTIITQIKGLRVGNTQS